MGYTVFFSQKRHFTTSEWGLIREAAINMFNRLKQVKGGNGDGRPLIDNTDIIFNGDRSKFEDHETFQLMKAGYGFQFCKTARKPYDRYVKAVLVVANYYAPGALEVTCDGDGEEGCWDEGVRIATIYAKGVPDRSPCSPIGMSQIASKECSKLSHDNVYEGHYTEIDEAIELWVKLTKGNKVNTFLTNYLKANIEDIKDTYTPT